jgi:hypothetical protein
VTDESISHKNGSIFVCYKSYFGLYFLANFDTVIYIGLCPPSRGGVKGPQTGERPCSRALFIDLIDDVPYATKYY